MYSANGKQYFISNICRHTQTLSTKFPTNQAICTQHTEHETAAQCDKNPSQSEDFFLL